MKYQNIFIWIKITENVEEKQEHTDTPFVRHCEKKIQVQGNYCGLVFVNS